MPPSFPGFSAEALRFLKSLKRNNRREWFQPRKHLYDQHVRSPMLDLIAAINSELARFAPEYITDPKKAIFRIYRDTRFSPDKTPYKTHVAASFFRRGSDGLGAGGYYFSVSADQVEIAGGIYHPERDTLLRIRTHIADNYSELARILADKKTRKYTGALQGGELTRMPKGFDPAHPAADLIKMKDWIFDVTLDATLARTPKLHKEIADRFRAMTPAIAYLNRPLLAKKAGRTVPRVHVL